MATIPSVESIPTRLPGSTEQQVYRRDVSDVGAPGRAVSKIGKDMQAEMERQQEYKDNEEYSEAQVNFQVLKAQQDAAYDNDDDEDTIVERYEGEINNGLAQAAAGITNGNIRNRFIEENRLSVEQGKIRMGALAHQKKGDKKIAFAAGATEVIHKNAIEGGDMVGAQQALANMYESMAEQGYITHAQAQQQTQASKHNMAIGRLKTMDPKSQIEALNEAWAKDLPLDVRVKLKEEAESEMMDDEALMVANKWMNDDLTIDEINQELAQITDSDMHDKVERRIFQMKNQDEAGLQERQSDLYEEHFADVAFGNKTIDDIQDLDKYGMNPVQITNLQSAEVRAIKKKAGQYVPSYSDPETLHALRGMIARQEIPKARTYFSENFAKLSDSHYRYFESQVQASKAKDPMAKGIRTLNQTMNRLLRENDMEKDFAVENQIWDNLERRFDNYVEREEKRPTDREMNEWAKDEFLNVRRDPDAWVFDDDEYIFNMNDTERQDFWESADFLRQSTPGISRDEIITRYERMLADRRKRQDAAE